MISLKQRDFYILTVYPLFSIGLAFLILPFLQALLDQIKPSSRGFLIFKGATVLIIVLSVGMAWSRVGQVGRDHDLNWDTRVVIEHVGKNSTIDICPEMSTIWSLHGYMARYGNVSLDYSGKGSNKFLLLNETCSPTENYDQVPLSLNKHKLYTKKN